MIAVPSLHPRPLNGNLSNLKVDQNKISHSLSVVSRVWKVVYVPVHVCGIWIKQELSSTLVILLCSQFSSCINNKIQ